MPSSAFFANATLQQTPLTHAPSRATQPELLNYSSKPQFSFHQSNFAKTSKTHNLGLPQRIHTVPNINKTPQAIGLISDSFNSKSFSSHFSHQLRHKL